MRAGRFGKRQIGHVLVDRHAGRGRFIDVAARHLVGDVPGEDVPDTGLAGLVAVGAGDDPAVDDAAHSGHVDQAVVVHHVTGRGAHDGEHLSGLDGLRRRRGDVRIDVADGDGDPLR